MENALTSIDFKDYLKRKKSEKKIFAHFCSYTPEELIHAAGILPVRIFGAESVERANSHLQSYCCSYARRALEEAFTGMYDGFVFVHSCDTLQRLADITCSIPGEFHDTLVLPISVEGSDTYLKKELDRFKAHLEHNTGMISDTALMESIQIYNENRHLLSQVYDIRKKGHIPASTVDRVMKTSMIMEKEEHTRALRSFLDEIEVDEPVHPRLLLTGSMVLNPEIFDVIEDYGSVVFDDLCVGSRYLIKVQDPTLEGLVQRYKSLWCPCRHVIGDRIDYLEKKCREFAVEGVVLLLQKFCEPHFFEAVHVRKELKERGIPTILLELQDQPVEQLRTRIQAFCEMVVVGE
ncbi:MAG: 2-hydroxyacyl-CoA dehydratase [Theionarchaea archaeon]|nr:2-hydroxyacyl-CoA dehydratase [Theionarchaea archaeon]